jgi:hypothetical protein
VLDWALFATGVVLSLWLFTDRSPWLRLPSRTAGRVHPPGQDAAQSLARAASTFGLVMEGQTISGEVDGMTVCATVTSARRLGLDRHKIEVTIEAALGFPGEVSLVPRFEKKARAFTGDQRFDDEYVARGDPTLVLALLDVSTRDLILGLAGRFDLDAEALVWRGTRAPTFLTRLIRQLTQFAIRMRDAPLDVPSSLIRNTRRDPVASVRERNLLTLHRELADDPRTEEVLLSALRDEAPSVRLRAALLLGDCAEDTLVEFVVDPESTEEMRLTAARRLRVGHPLAVEGLCALIENRSANVPISVVRAIGMLGTPAIIGRLRPYASGFRRDARVQSEIRDAIERITARNEHAAPGLLSIAGDESQDGELSVAPAETGALSEP